MKFYSIQAVAEMSGLSTHCIRAWEKRYGAIKPERSDNGRRVYSESELNRLQMLGKLSSLGNSISLIANLPDEDLEKLLLKMSNGKTSSQAFSKAKSLIDPRIYTNNLFMALSSYKLDVLTHELNKASMDLSCRDFALGVVGALFRKVGEYVHEGKMSIAQEHTLSAITKFFIGRRIGQHYTKDHKHKLKIVLATPIGEHHSIGLMLSSLLMAEHSVDFIYLGEDLPEESIAEAARATEADIVLLSISPVYAARNRGINEISMNLRHGLPSKTQIWVGGDITQLRAATIRDARISTFDNLGALDSRLAQLVGAE
jgi:DNA-binding transcriptional MerR regulator/methylmalonyl-CoA mutase cobalamin-binding subunit